MLTANVANIGGGRSKSVAASHWSHLGVLFAAVGLLDLRDAVKCVLAVKILEGALALPVLAATEEDDQAEGDESNHSDTAKDSTDNGANVGAAGLFIVFIVGGGGFRRGWRGGRGI